MTTVKLLRHQGIILQAPYIYENIRYFFDVAGYASGKTSALCYCIARATKDLQGKKDLEGHNPRIILGSKNLTFMMKTSVSNLEQTFRQTGTEYRFDKKNNIIFVGTVEIYLIPLENPENIYGWSVACFEENTLITTDKGEKAIKDIKEGDLVLTTKGFKRVKHIWDNGVRDCIEVEVDGRKILCTPDHRFIDSFDNEIEANDLTKTISLVKVDSKEWKKWSKENGEIEANLKSLTSMESDIIAIITQSHMVKGATSLVVMKIREKVTRLCTEIFGNITMVKYLKGMMYTTKTETLLTMILTISNLLIKLSTKKNIGSSKEKKDWKMLSKTLKRLKKEIRNSSKMKSTERKEEKKPKKMHKQENTNVSARFVEKSIRLTVETLITALMSAKERMKNYSPKKEDYCTTKKGFALFVEKYLKSTNTTKLLKPAHLTAKTSSVVGQYKVYDLEVEDVHEYFANGVRVHNCAFLDELSELPPDICMEAIKSINDRVRQQIDGFRTPFIVSVSSAQGLDGQYMAMEHFKRNGMGYFKVRGETRDNVFLPKSYVENLYKIYNDKERKVYLEGHFMSVNSSLVFSDYDPAKNMLAVDLYDSLEPDDTVYIGQDFNNFGCAGVACTVKKGCIVVLKDYNIPDIRRAPEIFRYDFPTQKIVWVPDATSTAFYSQFKKELRAKDIRIAYRKSNPLVQDRVFVINKLLYAERMFITPISKEVEKSMLTHQFDPKTHIPMKGGEGAPDHISDALGYAVYYIVCWDRSLKDLYDVTLGRAHLSRLGSMGTEVEAGYNLLNPSRIALEAPENVNKDDWEKASKS